MGDVFLIDRDYHENELTEREPHTSIFRMKLFNAIAAATVLGTSLFSANSVEAESWREYGRKLGRADIEGRIVAICAARLGTIDEAEMYETWRYHVVKKVGDSGFLRLNSTQAMSESQKNAIAEDSIRKETCEDWLAIIGYKELIPASRTSVSADTRKDLEGTPLSW